MLQQPIKVLWVGIGCKKGTSQQLIADSIQLVLRQHQLNQSALAGIATIDTKADEVGLVELCQHLSLPLLTFPAEVLSSICVPNSSQIVTTKVGTPSVAEAAALLAAKCQTLLVTKQIFKSSSELQGMVTIAIAQIENIRSQKKQIF